MNTVDTGSCYNFFTAPAPQPSSITEEQAADFARNYLGYPVMASSLGSQQDLNFLLKDESGCNVGILKIASPVFSGLEVAAQDSAADALAAAEPGLRFATLVPGADGQGAREIADENGMVSVARVLSFLPGSTVSGDRYLSPDAVSRMGEIAGRVSRALADFDHPGLNRVLQWDLRHARRVSEELLEYIEVPERRTEVGSAVDGAWRLLDPLRDHLPMQAVHLDLANSNMVCSPQPPYDYDGILDLGDLCRTWAVSELAATLTSVLHHPGAEAHSAVPAVEAFHRIRPLSEAEIDALWPMVVLRAATLVICGSHQVSIDPANRYAANGLIGEWRMFDAATAVPIEVMSGLIRSALGLASRPLSLPADGALLIAPDIAETVAALDLSTTSTVWNNGAWMAPETVDAAARQLADGRRRLVATRYAERTPAQVNPLSTDEPATVRTGMDLWFGQPATLVAPWPGHCVLDNGTVVLRAGELEIRVSASGVDTPEDMAVGEIATGAVLARFPAASWARLTLQRTGISVPETVRPSYAAGWLSLTADPAPLFGLSGDVPPSEPSALLARRRRSLAEVQEHYYRNPPQIERGWRHHMVSTDGRAYLDMVNNVAVLGHSHPRVAEAVHRQLQTLNTNSRFNYAAVVEFCERLTALLPAPLSQVFLVNSGSEAGDLAVRLAMAATGRHDIVAMGEAYHGWTYATDAISTSTADNPNALTTRPSWVHTVDSPNPYRGTHRGAAAHRYADDAVARLRELADRGVRPAAFIAESVYGNAGGMALPDGYLDRVYTTMRDLGGLAIADEVQVGYGRLGTWFWGFEQQNVVPDIVTMAKAMGNGYPLGVVVTSEAIAARYRTQGYFFSSAGGSPVSSVVGSTVLDVIADEGLQENARLVGTHLKEGLSRLGDKHPLIGTVHGHGLYLGVELVRDRMTLEPATEETRAICARMLDYGIIIQPTGDRNCILKIKPPLCLDHDAADFFVDTLDKVLTEGW